VTTAKQPSLAALERLREKIAGLQTQRATLARDTLSRTEVQAELAAYVERCALEGRGILGFLIKDAATGSPFRGLLDLKSHGRGTDAAALLCALLPEPITSALCDIAAEVIPIGTPPGDRARQLAELDAQILALEIDEESMIEALEAAFVSVDRRPDADPRAVLA